MVFERINRFLFYILLLVAPLIFFTDLTRNPYYLQIVLVLCSTLLLIIFYLLQGFTTKKIVLFTTPLDIPIISLIVVMFLSWFFAYLFPPSFFVNSIFNGLQNELRWSIYSEGARNLLFIVINCALVYWSVIYLIGTIPLRNQLLNLVVFTASLAALYGILQYFGIEFFWPKVLNPYGGRCVSTFGNPNFLSSFLVLILPYTFVKMLLTEKVYVKLYYLVCSIVIFTALICTLTRSSWVGLLVSFIICLIVLGKQTRDLIVQNKVIIWSLVGITLFIFFLFPRSRVEGYHPSVLERIFEVRALTKETYAPWHQRLMIWSCAWDMIKDNPILGKGWGSYELFYPFYQSKYLFLDVYKNLRTHANNAHNEFLEYWSQIGTLGFGIFIWLNVVLIYWSLKVIKQQKDKEEKIVLTAFFTGLIGMIVDNIFGNVSLHFAVPAYLYWFIVGLIAQRGIYRDRNPGKSIDLNKIPFSRTILLVLICLGSYLVLMYVRFFIAEIYYFRGFKIVRHNQLDAARVSLEKAHSLHRLEVNNNYELGNTYARLQQKDNAIKTYYEALRSNLGYDEIYFNLATVYSMTGDETNAVLNFRRAVTINTLSREAYLSLGNFYLRDLGKYSDNAIRIFERLTKLDPHNRDAWNNLGYLYMRLNNKDRAAECFRQALVIDPGFELAQKNLFTVQGNVRQNPKQETEINFLFRRIEEAVDQQKWAVALPLVQRMVSLDPLNLTGLLYLGNVYFNLNRFTEAATEYEKVLRIQPENVSVRLNLGLTYLKQGKRDLAKQEFTRILQIQPDNKNARDSLASLSSAP